jgi:hypothetical protein
MAGKWWVVVVYQSMVTAMANLMASFTSSHIIKFIVIHAFSPLHLHHIIHPSVGHDNSPPCLWRPAAAVKTNSMDHGGR